MTLATTPTNRITPLTPKFEMIVNRRWKEWEAAVIVWLGGKDAQPVHLRTLERWHSGWMVEMIGQSIPLRSIRKWNLDDPRESPLTLKNRVAEYIERRQRRHSANK
jgi:hypothetical protein